MQNTKSKTGLNYSVLAILLFVFAYFSQFLVSDTTNEFFVIVFGLMLVISFILAIIGGINTILGLKEESSREQMIGLIISSVFLMTVVYLVITVAQKF